MFCCKAAALNSDQLCCPVLQQGDNNDYVLPFFFFISWESNMLSPAVCSNTLTCNTFSFPACCINLWTHTSCLLCVFTTHSPNYSGTKQLNSTWSHSVHLPCGLLDYPNAAALHTPSCTRITHSTRDSSGGTRRQGVKANMSPKIIAKLLLKAKCVLWMCTVHG